ncbi:tRNA (adenosine(37)-N6)-threonylcarbamoyltransferase complex dimerization subunit type 1 TsaB [Herbaspirillum sp. LeCh32-8]|uniref:tRNA (adenosine(37)-N6)-threonylcarbamoyltransferase complex dimerization subunit type 1 TsaB n=1 Tax=Herbaspirillum sp. LeCh32-8 TaxID=2821356 RepID=UPI001AE7EED3|nr:tRNA (adenosine(37)-N6)-threonylcarbamoyltransferase complex dimerization subunit type 1 TsaB [Herbaspirillum sp. LeCh32-8]MBP0597071.1 tRNA (adenosine(37)-N6)-threonylcarbamoyltransferase complex dimerization subunit type 1 TsaB [Herbaspirillum sp. LeCh32-8]
MSTILAIETSTELASAALLHNGELIARESAGAQTHSDSILPMIQQLLAEAGIALARCDALAFGVGPGSFTGVRTACGVVQGLAFGIDRPVVPVVTLEAAAQAARALQADADEVLAILDARMGEVYWARYRARTDGGWDELAAPTLSVAAEVVTAARPVACGNGLGAYAAHFTPAFCAAEFAAALPQGMPHARHVASLGQYHFAHGRALPAQDAQPLYLRNKVALTTAEREVRDAGKAGA